MSEKKSYRFAVGPFLKMVYAERLAFASIHVLTEIKDCLCIVNVYSGVPGNLQLASCQACMSLKLKERKNSTKHNWLKKR